MRRSLIGHTPLTHTHTAWLVSRAPVPWQNGPWLNGTLDRDWPELGAKAEPKGATKDPSVRPDKIQIALSIYHSILAQV